LCKQQVQNGHSPSEASHSHSPIGNPKPRNSGAQKPRESCRLAALCPFILAVPPSLIGPVGHSCLSQPSLSGGVWAGAQELIFWETEVATLGMRGRRQFPSPAASRHGLLRMTWGLLSILGLATSVLWSTWPDPGLGGSRGGLTHTHTPRRGPWPERIT
jgi:hypothetical protein